MNKIYIAPEIDWIEIGTEDMIAESIPVSDDEADETLSVDSKSRIVDFSEDMDW